jgi:hypothetical protein
MKRVLMIFSPGLMVLSFFHGLRRVECVCKKVFVRERSHIMLDEAGGENGWKEEARKRELTDGVELYTSHYMHVQTLKYLTFPQCCPSTLGHVYISGTATDQHH